MITIDHVLTRNAVASSIKTIDIPGSDDRLLLATIKLELGPVASGWQGRADQPSAQ